MFFFICREPQELKVFPDPLETLDPLVKMETEERRELVVNKVNL